MKEKKRIKLLRSQKILLQKQAQENRAVIQAKQNELNQIFAVILGDLDIPENEFNQWQLSGDGQAVEKIEPPKPPKNKDKKKDKKERNE